MVWKPAMMRHYDWLIAGMTLLVHVKLLKKLPDVVSVSVHISFSDYQVKMQKRVLGQAPIISSLPLNDIEDSSVTDYSWNSSGKDVR